MCSDVIERCRRSRTRSPTATPCERPPNERLDELGDRRLAQEADAERGQRDPELAGREVLAEVVDAGAARGARAAVAVAASSSRRVRRERTSANSAATKNPLAKTSTTTATRKQRGHRQAAREPLLRGRSSCTRRICCGRLAAARAPAQESASIGAGEVEVGLGDPALAVGRERQPDLVPAVDEDVRVVVRRPRPRPPTRLTKAIAAAKSASSRSRTIASPSRRQGVPECRVDLPRQERMLTVAEPVRLSSRRCGS